jgi:hypothetical protein
MKYKIITPEIRKIHGGPTAGPPEGVSHTIWSGEADSVFQALEAANPHIPHPHNADRYASHDFGPDIKVQRQIGIPGTGLRLPLFRTVALVSLPQEKPVLLASGTTF